MSHPVPNEARNRDSPSIFVGCGTQNGCADNSLGTAEEMGLPRCGKDRV